MPDQAPSYTDTDNGEKMNLSSQDKTTYQKASGNYVSGIYDDLFKTNEFANYSELNDDYYLINDTSRANILKQIKDDANLKGRESIGAITSDTNKNLSKLNERNKALEEAGIPLADYYIAYEAQKQAISDKDGNGKTITYSRDKNRVKNIKTVVDDDLTKEQLEVLYGIFDISDKAY